jgi:hypothetical protein
MMQMLFCDVRGIRERLTIFGDGTAVRVPRGD